MKRLRFLMIGVALAALLPCGVMGAESWPADAPAVPEGVRRLMQDRNYAEAVKAIDAAAAAKDASKDYLAYLKGRALALQNRYDEAAAVFSPCRTISPRVNGSAAHGLPRLWRWLARAISAPPKSSCAPKPRISSRPIASNKSPTSTWSLPMPCSSRRKTT